MEYKEKVPGKYEMIGPIGSGASSNVYKIKDINTGNFYALKIFKKHKSSFDIEREIRMHSKLNHPNIIKLVEWQQDNDYIFIAIELCNSNLFQYLKHNKSLQEPEVISIVSEIAKAIKYLHDIGIAHRDIKLENVVKCDTVWKLIDFGFADHEKYFDELIGTLDYLAPEIVKQEKYKGFPTDVWALGILMYELLYGDPPFISKTFNETYNSIKNNEPDFSGRKINPKIEELIKAMLNKDPTQRITINQVIQNLNNII